MNIIYNMKKYRTFFLAILMICVFSPTNVKAIQTISPGDSDIKEKCDKYYDCIVKEIDKAKDDGKTLSSANVQNACNSVMVVNRNNTSSVSYDYCDTNGLLNGKSLRTLLEEGSVKDDNDAYQDNIQQCEKDKKKAIVKACSSCKKCMSEHEDELKDGACNSQCTVGNPSTCGNSNQTETQKKIPVMGGYCEFNSSNNSGNGSSAEDENYFKPIDSSKFVCGGMMSDSLLSEIVKLYKTVSMIMVVAVVIFGMLDFFKAVSAGDAETMKKVTKRFTNRLIIVILIAILPIVLELLLSLFGNDTMKTCLDKIK